MNSPITRSHTEIFIPATEKPVEEDDSFFAQQGESSVVSATSSGPPDAGDDHATRVSILFSARSTIPLNNFTSQDVTVLIPRDISKILSLGAKEITPKVSVCGEKRTIYARAKVGRNGKYYLGSFSCKLTLYYGEFSLGNSKVSGYFYIEPDSTAEIKNIAMKNVVIKREAEKTICYSSAIGIVVVNSETEIKNFFVQEIEDPLSADNGVQDANEKPRSWKEESIESIMAESHPKKEKTASSFRERMKNFFDNY